MESTETPRKVFRASYMENIARLSTPLKIPPSPFMKNLGYGTGVNVYQLERSPRCGQTRSPWAVKRISQKARAAGQKVFNARIQEEAETLRKLSHPNIVGYRGVAKTEDGVDSLALECCKTSLGTILEDRREYEKGPLPADQTIKMIVDISKALEYLHNEAKLLHGDLKSYNVLIKGDFEICKLCDFGVSIQLDHNGIINFKETPTAKYVGTSIWSAPEVIDNEDIIDCKADIFSFGLVIYETIALIPPHTLNLDSDEEYDESDIINVSEDSESMNVSASLEMESPNLVGNGLGTRPPLPQAFELSAEYNPIVELFYCCTNEEAEDRPMAKDIWKSFVGIN